MTAKKGDWVQIERVILSPQERAPQVPEDTKSVSFAMRVKGFLIDESAQLNAHVRIRTLTDRIVEGKLVEINPKYDHNFGEPVFELLTIGKELRDILAGGDQL